MVEGWLNLINLILKPLLETSYKADSGLKKAILMNEATDQQWRKILTIKGCFKWIQYAQTVNNLY